MLSSTPPIDSNNAGEVEEVRVGDVVTVTPLPGFGGASGVVVACRDDGFDMVQLDEEDGRPVGLTEVLWARVDEYEVFDPPPVLVLVYRGMQQADTTAAFSADADLLAQAGYRPTSQSWAQGQWGAWTFLLATVLLFVLIGILVFLYLLIVKPEGTLTVTCELVGGAPGDADPDGVSLPGRAGQEVGSSTLRDRLEQLAGAHDAGLITDQEFARKRQQLIDGL